MNQNAGKRRYGSHGQETDPRDGGCPRCGRDTTPVTLTDFGLETGQLCPHCGIVDAEHPIATDGGTDECDDCEQLDDDLPCFDCFRARDAPEPEPDEFDAEAERRESEAIGRAEDRAERALERGLWGVGGGR